MITREDLNAIRKTFGVSPLTDEEYNDIRDRKPPKMLVALKRMTKAS